MSTTNSKRGIKAIIIATLMVIATLSIQYYIGIKQDEKKCAQIVDRELQIASMKIETYLSTTQQAIDNIDDQIIKNLHSTDSIYSIMKRIVASNKNITGCAIGFIPYYYPDKGYWFEPSAYRQNDTIKTMQAGSKNHDYFNMEWYKSAINAKNTKTIWTSPYRDNTLNNLLMTSYCRVITIDNKPIGVVSLDLSLDYVSKTLSNIKPYNGSICQLHTRDGKIIVSTDNTQPTTSKYLIASQPIAQQKLTLQIASPKNAVYGDTILINLITLLLITITLLLLAYIVRQTIRNINKLNTVRQQQNIVENELRIARSIQTSMLPKTFPPYPDCDQVEIYGKLTPAKSVGGDLYDFFLRDQKLYFIIGDVSGKGIPASLVMSVTRTLFRTISNHETQPQRIVSQLSNTIAEENQLNMFVTLFRPNNRRNDIQQRRTRRTIPHINRRQENRHTARRQQHTRRSNARLAIHTAAHNNSTRHNHIPIHRRTDRSRRHRTPAIRTKQNNRHTQQTLHTNHTNTQHNSKHHNTISTPIRRQRRTKRRPNPHGNKIHTITTTNSIQTKHHTHPKNQK